jgi:flagellar basal-body rod protein FlgB
MDLSQIKVFKAIDARMRWLTDRQRVLAQNVANADTPGYSARDVAPLDFRSLLSDNHAQQLKMAATSDAHKAAVPRTMGSKVRADDKSFQSSPTGNSVTLEEEMMKVAETAQDYELMTNLYRKSVGMLRLAMSKSGS